MGDRRPKIQYQQLPLAFMTEGRGETPDAGREGTESPTAKRGPESPAAGESLMEEVGGVWPWLRTIVILVAEGAIRPS